jgi:branched-chain amino acid transport system permease protein
MPSLPKRPKAPKLPLTDRWRALPASRRSVITIALFAVIAITWPWWRPGSSGIPLITEFPTINTGVIMVIYAIMAVGLNIVVGYAGLLDLGYVAFYAMGAYTAGWLASLQFSHVNFHFWTTAIPGTPGFHISIWLILAIAGIGTAVVGILIGLPTLRLRGDYLAIVTLGFGEILPQIARNGDNLGGFNLTNGPNGITPIDAPGFPGLSKVTGGVLPSSFLDVANRDNVYYWAALVLLAITVFTSLRLRDSRLGRAWIAIREDETAAAAMGVPLMRTKTWAYATGAFFGGVAGAYFASFKSSTFPGDFSFNISAFILSMVILGGMGNVWGVIFGAFFLTWLNFEGLANISHSLNSTLGTHIDGPKYSAGIFGLILVVTMLVRPEGLIPSARRKAELHEGVHEESLYDVEHGARMYEEQGPEE